jgi:K+-sensing histidine kinase KdpD
LVSARRRCITFIVDYKKSKGTSNREGGLGLVLCKDFVQKLGGNMTVSSELNQGSALALLCHTEALVNPDSYLVLLATYY